MKHPETCHLDPDRSSPKLQVHCQPVVSLKSLSRILHVEEVLETEAAASNSAVAKAQ